MFPCKKCGKQTTQNDDTYCRSCQIGPGENATSEDKFLRHLEAATAEVAKWPEWKQNVLSHTRPALKEERMKQPEFETCPACGHQTRWKGDVEKGAHGIRSLPCGNCAETSATRAATLRAVYERAFDAALRGLAGMARGDGEPAYSDRGAIAEADGFALEAVRTHAARMDALEKAIAELEVTE